METPINQNIVSYDMQLLQENLSADTAKYLLNLKDQSLKILFQNIFYNEFVANCLLLENLKQVFLDLPLDYLQTSLQKTLNTTEVLSFPDLKDKIMKLKGNDNTQFFLNLSNSISNLNDSDSKVIMMSFSVYDIKNIISTLSTAQINYLKILISYAPQKKLQPFLDSLKESFAYIGVF